MQLPGMLSTYSRQYGGWLTPISITRNGYYAVQPAELSATVYRIDAGFPSGEYLLVENRQGIKWDSDWPGNGIVIFHVDEKVSDSQLWKEPGGCVR
jgi:immune inhibitor A